MCTLLYWFNLYLGSRYKCICGYLEQARIEHMQYTGLLSPLLECHTSLSQWFCTIASNSDHRYCTNRIGRYREVTHASVGSHDRYEFICTSLQLHQLKWGRSGFAGNSEIYAHCRGISLDGYIHDADFGWFIVAYQIGTRIPPCPTATWGISSSPSELHMLLGKKY